MNLHPEAANLDQQSSPYWIGRIREYWRHRIAWYVLAAAGVSATGLLFFAMTGEEVFEHDSGSFDDGVRSWVLAHRTPTLLRIFTWVTNAGSTVPVFLVTLLACAWLWRSKARHAATGAIAAPALAVAIFTSVKTLSGRLRPPGAVPFGIHTYAFPSGHATTSLASAAILAYVLWRERLVGGFPALAVATVIPLLIGFSRVYLDVHWATDVLGGWFAGLFVAGLAAAIYEQMRRDPVVAFAEGASVPPS